MHRPGATAIKDLNSAHLLLERPPARPAGPDGVLPGRFSPLSARQRKLVDDFVAEARPWALRQARRAYAHLPAELHEQAVDQAAIDLRTRTASRTDRRGLYGHFADALNVSLARIHTGWCLNQARVARAADTATAPPPPADVAHPIAGFVEEGLGGLERAVLQLEIGAGRDTATARAALRLGPGQYRRHRERGLSKLRSAIAAQVEGRVCDQHVDAVMRAATGDGAAAAGLAAGADRCRACAREAATLRRLLHDRLAVAPWPIAVKPAGVLAAKIGGLGAALGGKGGGLTGTAGAGKGIATVLAAAAASTGVVAAQAERAPVLPVVPTTASAEPRTVTSAAAPVARRAQRAEARRDRRPTRGAGERTADTRTTSAPRDRTPASTPAPPPASAPAPTAAALPSPQPVRETIATVERTTDKLVGRLRAKLPSVSAPQTTAPRPLRDTVEQVTGAAGQLLTP